MLALASTLQTEPNPAKTKCRAIVGLMLDQRRPALNQQWLNESYLRGRVCSILWTPCWPITDPTFSKKMMPNMIKFEYNPLNKQWCNGTIYQVMQRFLVIYYFIKPDNSHFPAVGIALFRQKEMMRNIWVLKCHWEYAGIVLGQRRQALCQHYVIVFCSGWHVCHRCLHLGG